MTHNPENNNLRNLRVKMKKQGNYPRVLEITQQLDERVNYLLLENCAKWYLNEGDLEKAAEYFIKLNSVNDLIEIGNQYGKEELLKALKANYKDGESLDTKLNLLSDGFEPGIELYKLIGYQKQAEKCRLIKTMVDMAVNLENFSYEEKKYVGGLITNKKHLENILASVPNSKMALRKLIDKELMGYKPLGFRSSRNDAILMTSGVTVLGILNYISLLLEISNNVPLWKVAVHAMIFYSIMAIPLYLTLKEYNSKRKEKKLFKKKNLELLRLLRN